MTDTNMGNEKASKENENKQINSKDSSNFSQTKYTHILDDINSTEPKTPDSSIENKTSNEETRRYSTIQEDNLNEENIKDITKKLKLDTTKVSFKFPFIPYPSQKLMIKTLISAFLENKHAIIESPTGTGKTLTICAAIDAYLDLYHESYTLSRNYNTQPDIQRFYILSRTHTQLSQIHKCLNENYNISTTTLGSRNIYCLKNKDNIGCKNAVKEKKCEYFNKTNKLTKKILNHEGFPKNLTIKDLMTFPINLEHTKVLNNNTERNVPKFDIESIKTLGKQCRGCPYYASKELYSSGAIITLAPYNYLFDPMIIRHSDINLMNSIIIIDEAHNIDNICRDAGSLLLTQVDLENIQYELYYYMKKDPKTYNFISLLNLIKEYRKHKIGVFTGNEININISLVEQASKELSNLKELELDHEQILITFIFILNLIKKEPKVYSLKVENEQNFLKIQFYLNDPSIIFNDLKHKARSIILLSGTMNPFNLIKNELQLLNCDTHIMPHVLDKNRLKVYNLTKSRQNQELKGVYANINEPWFIKEIIDAIIISRNLMEKRKLRGGILVFVPSYNLIKQIKESIKFKNCFYENDEDAMDRYKIILDNNPVLIAVYRGKLSEGMDFRDDLCRVLIAVGVPYPQINDICIVEKRKFNDKFSVPFSKQSCKCELNKCSCFRRQTLSSKIWYEGQALKAVNQAIGRIIRHHKDFGIVFLLDSRWSYLNKNLSKWIRESITSTGKFSEMVKSIDSTFEYFKKLN